MKRYDLDMDYGHCALVERPDGEYILYADHVEAMKRIAGGSAQQAPVAKINGSDESYGFFRQLEWLTPDGPYSLKAGTRLYAAPSASAQQAEPKKDFLNGWREAIQQLPISREDAAPASDQAADRQWRAGFLAGWNAGIEGDEAKLRAAQNRVGKLADYEASASPAALTDEVLMAVYDAANQHGYRFFERKARALLAMSASKEGA